MCLKDNYQYNPDFNNTDIKNLPNYLHALQTMNKQFFALHDFTQEQLLPNLCKRKPTKRNKSFSKIEKRTLTVKNIEISETPNIEYNDLIDKRDKEIDQLLLQKQEIEERIQKDKCIVQNIEIKILELKLEQLKQEQERMQSELNQKYQEKLNTIK